MKICSKCEREYPATTEFFPPNGHHKDGLQSQCRKCKQKATRKYRQTVNGCLRIVFCNIKRRCNSGLKDLKNATYSKKGIKNLFKSSDEFVDYVVNVLKVDPHGLQVDRINNDGHYEPGNIRFVTAKVNSNNRG